MKSRKAMTGAAIVGALVLLATSAAFAEHKDRRHRGDRWDGRIRAVAHDLEEAARHVHRAAERSRHHFDGAEEAALRDLHYLDDRARHFHRQVERYYRDPYHTERDFLALREAYFRAAESLHYLHAVRHVERDFFHVTRLMRDLDYFYPRVRPGRYYDHDSDWHRHHRRGWYDRHGRFYVGGQVVLPKILFQFEHRR